MTFESKAIQVPVLTYDAIQHYAIKNKITMKEAARRILFTWTLYYWSEGCLQVDDQASTNDDSGSSDEIGGSH